MYVDELITIGNYATIVRQFIQTLSSKFSVKDLDDLHFF